VELGYSLLILPWHEPLENSLSMSRTAFERLRNSGDIEMASYAAVAASCVVVETAATLAQAEQSVTAMLEFSERMNQTPRTACLAALLAFTGRLRGRGVAPRTQIVGYPYVDIHVFTYMALTALVMGDSQALARHVETLEPSIAVHKVMYAGALAGVIVCWRDIDRLTAGRMPASTDVARVDARMAWLRRAARRLPANFAALHHLLEARLAAAQGRTIDAMTSFDEAIRAAGSVSRPWQQALVLEHAGRFWLSCELPAFGERAMREAHRHYLLWGATHKAERLVQEFGFLGPVPSPTPLPVALSMRLGELDAAALQRALQALSAQTDMSRLVERILSIAVQFSGATSASLLRQAASGSWQAVGQTRVDERLPLTLVRYASRMLRRETIDDLATDARFAADSAVGDGPRSVLVMPITDKGLAHAILLLENHQQAGFFTAAHLDTLQMITGQLSISLRNAEVHQTLEMRVTERSRELQRVATALALRDRALDSSSKGVHISELTSAGHLVVYVNPMLEKISGFTSAELIGAPIWMLLGVEPGQAGARELRESVEALRPASATLRCHRRDGTTFWNELTISPIPGAREGAVSFVGVHTDVSERVHAAEEDERRTARLRAVFQLSADGFVVLDSTARISIVNPAFCRMTGLVADELLGRKLSEFEQALEQIAVTSDDAIDRSVFANMRPGEPAADIDAGMGEHGWLLTIAGPPPRTLVRQVRRAHNGPETVIFFRDVTREIEVDRMNTMFLSVAAHELRTPMTSIYGFSELLVAGDLPHDQQAGRRASGHPPTVRRHDRAGRAVARPGANQRHAGRKLCAASDLDPVDRHRRDSRPARQPVIAANRSIHGGRRHASHDRRREVPAGSDQHPDERPEVFEPGHGRRRPRDARRAGASRAGGCKDPRPRHRHEPRPDGPLLRTLLSRESQFRYLRHRARRHHRARDHDGPQGRDRNVQRAGSRHHGGLVARPAAGSRRRSRPSEQPPRR
ncbi:MAG: histidine kinase, partial [Rhizobacter sp.]|nr:histidine kinase [Rhizobacter sp.]